MGGMVENTQPKAKRPRRYVSLAAVEAWADVLDIKQKPPVLPKPEEPVMTLQDLEAIATALAKPGDIGDIGY